MRPGECIIRTNYLFISISIDKGMRESRKRGRSESKNKEECELTQRVVKLRTGKRRMRVQLERSDNKDREAMERENKRKET